MSKPKAIVSVINDLNTDQRVHKVCSFLTDCGYDVLLVGRKKRDSKPMEQRPYRTRRMVLFFEKGALFYAFFNLRLFFFLLFRPASLFVSNDLDTLLPNYLVSRFRGKKMVYDSHEYFTEVPELLHRPKVRKVWERIEKFIFPKLTTVYTVNRSIADKYSQKYGVDVKIVRNVSPLWKPEAVRSKTELGIPENVRLLIMQGAGLNVDRGVEEAISMMKYLENTVLLIVGDGDIIPAMKQRVLDEKLSDKVVFYGKRPYSELMQFTWHADLGLSLDQPTNPNYLYSLPNKVFDYMHTVTPIVCSDVVEVAALVRKYDIGVVLQNYHPEEMAKNIRALLNDSVRMEQLRNHCREAAILENWEAETAILKTIYQHVG